MARRSRVPPFTLPEAQAAELALRQLCENLETAEKPRGKDAKVQLAFTLAAARAAQAKAAARVKELGPPAEASGSGRYVTAEDLEDPNAAELNAAGVFKAALAKHFPGGGSSHG